jgi:hypothetical protein
MTQNEPVSKERIGAQLPSHACYIGTDADGGVHYWSTYEQAAYVVDGGEIDTWAVVETPLETLGDWVEHVRTKRGWRESRVVSGGLETLVVRVEVSG